MGIIALQTVGRETHRMGRARVRRVRFLWGVIPVATGAVMSPAQAVDLVNRDRAAREIIVNHSDGRSETITVAAGQRIAKICRDCVILAETTSVEAEGNATVKIERGEVSIDGKR